MLPKVRDSWSYLYVEHARIDQEDKGICLHDEQGRVHVPCASLSLLMLGPGTSVTHAAVLTMAEAGCLVAWCGEQGVRCYAHGMGETRSAARMLQQVRLWAEEQERMRIVRRNYEVRFPDALPADLTLRQIRGKEGARVRAAYAREAERFGLPWTGREYHRMNWDSADPVNRALSAANSCLFVPMLVMLHQNRPHARGGGPIRLTPGGIFCLSSSRIWRWTADGHPGPG